MLTGVNRLKTTGRHGSQVEDAIPPTSTGAVASTQGARGGGLGQVQALSPFLSAMISGAWKDEGEEL